MNEINSKTVIVSTSSELKNVLENDNDYEYIYLENDITLESGIKINHNKNKIIIDGTYQNARHTLTGMNSIEATDTINASSFTKEVKIKNVRIINTNIYGIICVPTIDSSNDIVIIYENITFNGTKLSFNPYGTIKISDSYINVANTNSIEAQEVCEGSHIIIGGKTNISSSSTNFPLFSFKEDDVNPYLIFLCKSDIILSSNTRELIKGTDKLNFTILHDTIVHLNTGNGFAQNSDEGVNNVLIDERSSLIFLEKSHEKIPMWAIFGTLTMKEDSELQMINSYDNTPSDNYNIHFKGTDCRLNLYNPKNLTIYTKNSNVIYTDNVLNYTIECSRINMWKSAVDISSAGDINNIPDYSWYKENDILKIDGIITSTLTSITKYNLTQEELKNMPDIGNFVFQGRKQLSIGSIPINIHPINKTKNVISGHTTAYTDVLIKYDNTKKIVTSDENGLFKYDLLSPLEDNTKVELIANIASSFIYKTRTITTPTTGELTLLEVNPSIDFSQLPISKTLIFPKAKDLKTIIVDSRESSSNWKLYAYINKPLTSSNGFILNDALVFKKFDDEIIKLTTYPKLCYTGKNNEGIVSYNELNWSKEKGPLLDLTNDAMEANEEYFSTIYFNIEE